MHGAGGRHYHEASETSDFDAPVASAHYRRGRLMGFQRTGCVQICKASVWFLSVPRKVKGRLLRTRRSGPKPASISLALQQRKSKLNSAFSWGPSPHSTCRLRSLQVFIATSLHAIEAVTRVSHTLSEVSP